MHCCGSAIVDEFVVETKLLGLLSKINSISVAAFSTGHCYLELMEKFSL